MKHTPEIFISTDQEFLDLAWIGKTLREEKWGAWVKQVRLEAAIKNSLCFGAYWKPLDGDFLRPKQSGFARVVTDKFCFSSLMDVVVDKWDRGKGIGTKMMECILAHPDVRNTIMVLGTTTAQPFYKKLGFVPTPEAVLKHDPYGSYP